VFLIGTVKLGRVPPALLLVPAVPGAGTNPELNTLLGVQATFGLPEVTVWFYWRLADAFFFLNNHKACTNLSSEHILDSVSNSCSYSHGGESETIVGSNDDLMVGRKRSWKESDDGRFGEKHLDV
jgi:hypothetical protein